MAAPIQMNGTAITFDSGFFAQILDFTHGGIERAMISKAHAGTTGGIEFDPSAMYDPGFLECRLKHDPTLLPALTGALESTVVDHPGAATDKWTASGALQSFSKTGSMEDHVESTGRVKLSGNITITV